MRVLPSRSDLLPVLSVTVRSNEVKVSRYALTLTEQAESIIELRGARTMLEMRRFIRDLMGWCQPLVFLPPNAKAQRTRTAENGLIIPEASRRCRVRCSAILGGCLVLPHSRTNDHSEEATGNRYDDLSDSMNSSALCQVDDSNDCAS